MLHGMLQLSLWSLIHLMQCRRRVMALQSSRSRILPRDECLLETPLMLSMSHGCMKSNGPFQCFNERIHRCYLTYQLEDPEYVGDA
ncbi:hypothetical protein DM02DRAFT_251917 [Periconia macrospinosa]|uniref:Secreted protein n=1 Tax=Periconia macrospinosa TaxID=97972 RepID=A0A2V1D502_9PLEO|nr:hypothetical protein DM02DRAFT_251917 [Periconia macrospinosa]